MYRIRVSTLTASLIPCEWHGVGWIQEGGCWSSTPHSNNALFALFVLFAAILSTIATNGLQRETKAISKSTCYQFMLEHGHEWQYPLCIFVAEKIQDVKKYVRVGRGPYSIFCAMHMISFAQFLFFMIKAKYLLERRCMRGNRGETQLCKSMLQSFPYTLQWGSILQRYFTIGHWRYFDIKRRHSGVVS